MSTEHELKTWPAYFRAVWDGMKTFELRRDDRGFAVGDVLWLREWEPATREYTDRHVRARVTYLLRGDDPEGWFAPDALGAVAVVMAIAVAERYPAPPSPREHRRPRDTDRPSSTPFATPSGYVGGTAGGGAGPVFPARFDGRCGCGGDTIDEGDEIRMVDGEAWLASCWADEMENG